MRSISWTEVCARRLDRHGLAEPRTGASPAEIVGAMSGAHAQVLSAAELSVGLRIAGSTRQNVRHALWTDRSLVKSFGPRGTVHLLPTRDLPLWTGALSGIPSTPSPFPAGIRMTPDQTEQVVEAIGLALSDAELTVDELTEAVVERAGSWAGDLVMPAFQDFWPRWRQATTVAANRGVLCFGANRGRKVTYTNPHRWLPGFRPADPDAALSNLVTRYLDAYGPATPQQFARWLSAPISWATALFKSLDLLAVQLDGTTAWLSTSTSAPEANGVRLLPYFDAYTVGCYPRDLLFPGRAWERALARGQAGNYPVLLVDGTVKGVWHQRRSGRKIDVTVEPFGQLTTDQKDALDDQVLRIGEILEGTPTLTIGAVTVGPHA
ncbi:MAG: winged helix DNA-binding domain-containing protein [Kibdelosporangium sp.]